MFDSAPPSKNALSAFQITSNLLSFTLEDSRLSGIRKTYPKVGSVIRKNFFVYQNLPCSKYEMFPISYVKCFGYLISDIVPDIRKGISFRISFRISEKASRLCYDAFPNYSYGLFSPSFYHTAKTVIRN